MLRVHQRGNRQRATEHDRFFTRDRARRRTIAHERGAFACVRHATAFAAKKTVPTLVG